MNGFQSLIPYLRQDQQKFGLHLPYMEPLSEADPFYRIHEVYLVTDSGDQLQKKFLLIQKDQYNFSDNLETRLTNTDIDFYWQQSFKELKTGHRKSPGFTILNQMDNASENLARFYSLFFCLKSKLFFHPPCPYCGKLLDLCTDDSLLEQKDLPLYSFSTKRFLFCPDCIKSKDMSLFFTFKSESHLADWVQDQFDLINAYKDLLVRSTPPQALPCQNCPYSKSCNGQDEKGRNLIIPFAFYPHYLLFYEAMDFQAPDFLALLSRATVGQLAKHYRHLGQIADASRIKNKENELKGNFFFFDKGEGAFRETLYLKLCFLQIILKELVDCQSNSDLSRLNIPPQLNSYWIQIQDTIDPLPRFWSFKPCRIGLNQHFASWQSSVDKHLVNGLKRLGLFWFKALFGNSSMNMSRILDILGNCSLACKSQDLRQAYDPPQMLSQEFPPSCLFYEQDPLELSKNSLKYWHKSLEIGWHLFMDEFIENQGSFIKSMANKLDTLLQEIRTDLFDLSSIQTSPKNGMDESKEKSNESLQISRILKSILSRWETDQKQVEKISSLSESSSSEDDTLILQADQNQDRPQDSNDQDTMSLDETMMETVILSTDTFSSQPLSSQEPLGGQHKEHDQDHSPSCEEELQKTVFINTKEQSSNEKQDNTTNDHLKETMIINKDKKTGQSYSKEDQSTEQELFQSGFKEQNRKKQSSTENYTEKKSVDESMDENYLEKTVILDPSRFKGGDN